MFCDLMTPEINMCFLRAAVYHKGPNTHRYHQIQLLKVSVLRFQQLLGRAAALSLPASPLLFHCVCCSHRWKG